MRTDINDGLPSSIQTEVTVLGAMLLDGIAITDATAKLVPEDFSLDSHQRVYRVMVDMLGRGNAVDLITVMDALSKRRELDAIGGAAYLAFLTEGIPRNPNIESYVRIVKDKSLLRQLLGIFNDGMVAASDQTEDARKILNEVESRLAAVSDSTIQNGFSSMADILAQSFVSVDQLYAQGKEITGLETGFIDFDKMTSGLQNGELVIIAARPSMGKTAWAINIAQNVAIERGKVVGVFSLEMNKASLLRRMLSSESLVGARKIQSGFIAREDKGKLNDALEAITGSRMYIDDTPSISLSEMRAKARRLKQQHGQLDLIVIDYLQLMSGKGENRTQEVSGLSRGLKALAKELNVPVVALSQLSRASEQRGGDKKPMLSDLRESGAIEQDADVVAFIHRAEYYDRDNEDLKGKAELIVAKQRNGPTGTVYLAYLEEYTKFMSASYQERQY